MATLIPVEGELTECPDPADENAIRITLGFENIGRTPAADGSTWWYVDPTPVDAEQNDRATRFLNARNGHSDPADWKVYLYGKVLYLSIDETRKIDRVHEDMLPIRGQTYHVRDKLKALGARWDQANRVWMIVRSRLPQAEEIVRKGP